MRAIIPLLCALLVVGLLATVASAEAIYIFGGADHKEFLGCLNCSATDAGSLWNDYSNVGIRNDYGKWNPFGQYANPYSSDSACNEYTNEAPVIVGQSGDYYGKFSVNSYAPDSICGLQGNTSLCAALTAICASK